MILGRIELEPVE